MMKMYAKGFLFIPKRQLHLSRPGSIATSIKNATISGAKSGQTIFRKKYTTPVIRSSVRYGLFICLSASFCISYPPLTLMKIGLQFCKGTIHWLHSKMHFFLACWMFEGNFVRTQGYISYAAVSTYI